MVIPYFSATRDCPLSREERNWLFCTALTDVVFGDDLKKHFKNFSCFSCFSWFNLRGKMIFHSSGLLPPLDMCKSFLKVVSQYFKNIS